MAHRIVELADSKQASDIVLLDIRHLSTIADYFVICSGDNERQLRTIVETIDEQIGKEYGLHARIDGQAATGWIVLDYHDIIVHVFSGAQREYYRLEWLWSKASPVVVVQ